MAGELRPYQEELLERVETALKSKRSRIMLQLPTGGGKTRIAGELLAHWLTGGRKAVWLTHRKELARQTQAMLREAGVHARADLPWYRDDAYAPGLTKGVVILMAQTVSRRNARVNVWGVFDSADLMIVDEAHHATSPGWKRAMNQWPGPVLGMTATPWRLSKKEGFDRLFEQLQSGPQIATLQAQRALSPARVLMPAEDDLFQGGQIASTGDYTDQGIQQANEYRNVWTAGALEFWHRHCANRQTVVYAVSVGHAERLVGVFRGRGIAAEALLGETSTDERAKLIEHFQDGTIRVLINVEVVTEGFDLPDASCILMTRPTMSLALYLQMVGRGLRPKEDGSDCVILDMAGNSLRHGLPEQEREWSLQQRSVQSSGEPLVIRCTECESTSPAGSHHCRHCGAALGQDCDRCGSWRAWRGWRLKTMCGQAHDLVCDRCHNDAHLQARLPPIENLEELAIMEPSHEDIKERFKAIAEELEGRLSPQGIFNAWQDGGDFDALNEERKQILAEQKRIRPIALAEELLKAKQRLADEIAKAVGESGLAELLGEPVRNIIYHSDDDLGLDINVEEEELFEAQSKGVERNRKPCLCGCGGYPSGRRSRYLPGHDAIHAKQMRQAELLLQDSGRASEWQPLVDLTYSNGDSAPLRMQFPDGSAVPVEAWYDLMVETTRWLTDNGFLQSRDCPISVSRKRHLVSTSPYGPGGKPMRTPKQVGSFYVEVHYQAIQCIRNALTIIERVDQDPGQFHVQLR